MDFTREPIIETVVTPREGCKLVVRSSKSSGQEEYFVDSVEVVSFGQSLFFRSLERPKPFLVPVSDYEILEVREARMVLKTVGQDRSIKIGGGKEPSAKQIKEPLKESFKESFKEPLMEREPLSLIGEEVSTAAGEEAAALPLEGRLDKKRGRRHYRRRRGRDETPSKEATEALALTGSLEETLDLKPSDIEGKIDFSKPLEAGESAQPLTTTPLILSSILPPPPTLISETIARYKDNALFKGAFFVKEEKPTQEESEEKE